MGYQTCHNYPVLVCAAELCVWSRRFVYVCCQKIDLFSALPFELYYLIVKFKHLQRGFLHPASCTDRAILCMFYLKLTMVYCIIVCHTFFMHYATCSSSATCWMHSTCNAVIATCAAVLWQCIIMTNFKLWSWLWFLLNQLSFSFIQKKT